MKACSKLAVGGLVLGLSMPAVAEVSRAEVEALRAEIAQLRAQQAQQTDNWMNERRAAEVRAIVQEVLADAETRASLLQEGMYAGHNGSKFFLQSADGGYLMEVDGQIQLRYTYNRRNGSHSSVIDSFGYSDDSNVAGFELRRTKIQFSGHIADPRLKYALRLSVDRYDNVVEADRIVIGYQFGNFYLWGGEDKAPFTREELVSSAYQLAAERSVVGEVFSVDRAQGVGLVWHDPAFLNDSLKVQVMVNDGLRSGDGATSSNPFTQYYVDSLGDTYYRYTNKSFSGDASDFAVTARADVRLAGQWEQWKDFTSFPGEEFAAFVGGAIHWEVGRTGDTLLNNDFFMWTLDASVEVNGLNAFAAIYGMHTDNEGGVKDYDIYGFVIQGGYNIAVGDDSFEPFVRYEYIDLDGAASDAGLTDDDTINLITFGANYYLNRHSAKVTVDIVWVLDPMPYGFSGQGLLADLTGEDDQVVFRGQFQLLY